MTLATETREALSRTVEALIELLDAIGPDADLEEEPDRERNAPHVSRFLMRSSNR
jgi:hypothetical protein